MPPESKPIINRIYSQFAQMTGVQPQTPRRGPFFVCDADGNPTAELTEEGERLLLLHPEVFDDMSHVDL